jgi:hypothetical protein
MTSVEPKTRAAKAASTRSPGPKGDPGRQLLAAMLDDYYGGSITELAAALGAARDTVRGWIERPPTRPRRSTLRRIGMLDSLLRAASPYMNTSRQVGQWSLAPHPAFGGASPAGAVAAEGFKALYRIRVEMVDYVPARPDLPLAIAEDQLREDLAAGRDAESARRLAGILAAPELELTEEDLADLDRPEPEHAEKRKGERIVAPNPERGGWDVLKPKAGRASAHAATKAGAERRAVEMLRKEGGGGLRILDQAGAITKRREVAPSAPRSAKAPAARGSSKGSKRKAARRAGRKTRV